MHQVSLQNYIIKKTILMFKNVSFKIATEADNPFFQIHIN